MAPHRSPQRCSSWRRGLAAALLLPLILPSTPAYALRAGLEGHEEQVSDALRTPVFARPTTGLEEGGLKAFGALAGTWQALPDAPGGFMWYQVTFADRNPVYVQAQDSREAEAFKRVQARWLTRVMRDPAPPASKHYVTTGNLPEQGILPRVETTQIPDSRLGFLHLLDTPGSINREDILAACTIDLLVAFAHTLAAEVGRTRLRPDEQKRVRDVTILMLSKELNRTDATAVVATTTRFLSDPKGDQASRMMAIRTAATNTYNGWLATRIRNLLKDASGPIWIDAQNTNAILALAPEGSVPVEAARAFLAPQGRENPEATLRLAKTLLASGLEEAWRIHADRLAGHLSTVAALRDSRKGQPISVLLADVIQAEISVGAQNSSPTADQETQEALQTWSDLAYVLTGERHVVEGDLLSWLIAHQDDRQWNTQIGIARVVTLAALKRFQRGPLPTSAEDFVTAISRELLPASMGAGRSPQIFDALFREAQPLLPGVVARLAEVMRYPHPIAGFETGFTAGLEEDLVAYADELERLPYAALVAQSSAALQADAKQPYLQTCLTSLGVTATGATRFIDAVRQIVSDAESATLITEDQRAMKEYLGWDHNAADAGALAARYSGEFDAMRMRAFLYAIRFSKVSSPARLRTALESWRETQQAVCAVTASRYFGHHRVVAVSPTSVTLAFQPPAPEPPHAKAGGSARFVEPDAPRVSRDETAPPAQSETSEVSLDRLVFVAPGEWSSAYASLWVDRFFPGAAGLEEGVRYYDYSRIEGAIAANPALGPEVSRRQQAGQEILAIQAIPGGGTQWFGAFQNAMVQSKIQRMLNGALLGQHVPSLQRKASGQPWPKGAVVLADRQSALLLKAQHANAIIVDVSSVVALQGLLRAVWSASYTLGQTSVHSQPTIEAWVTGNDLYLFQYS